MDEKLYKHLLNKVNNVLWLPFHPLRKSMFTSISESCRVIGQKLRDHPQRKPVTDPKSIWTSKETLKSIDAQQTDVIGALHYAGISSKVQKTQIY